MVHFEIKTPALQDVLAEAMDEEISREVVVALIASLTQILPTKPLQTQEQEDCMQDVKQLLKMFERLLRENPKEQAFKFVPFPHNLN